MHMYLARMFTFSELHFFYNVLFQGNLCRVTVLFLCKRQTGKYKMVKGFHMVTRAPCWSDIT